MDIYKEEDLYKISWEEFDNMLDKIYGDINNFINEKNYSIKYIVPILRGGGFPGLKLSHMFDNNNVLPIQFQHNQITMKVELMLGLDYVKDTELKENECILLVEANHATGETASNAADLIRGKFGENIPIIYVSLTRDYTYKDAVKGVIFTTWGLTTNEMREQTEEKCKELGISYNQLTVFPWEDAKTELSRSNIFS